MSAAFGVDERSAPEAVDRPRPRVVSARIVWARIAQVLLAAWAVDAAVALLFGMLEASLLRRYADGTLYEPSGLRRAGSRACAVMGISVLLTLLTAVAFITWMFLESRRLELRERPKRYRAGWTIGAWFVPVAGLLLPYNVMGDLWASAITPDAQLLRSSGSSARRSTHRLVTAWWSCLVSVAVFGTGASMYPIVGLWILPVVRAIDPLAADAPHMSPSEMALLNDALLVRDAVLLVAAVLAIVIVQRLSFGEVTSDEPQRRG